MKNIFVSLILVAAFVGSVSCKKSEENFATGGDFTGTIVSVIETRTTLSGYDISWEKGDPISINGVKYKVTSESGVTPAQFSYDDTKPAPVAPFTAFFPSSIFDGTVATLPAEQTYGSFSVNPMYAFSQSTSLQFKNICGILAVTVTSSDMATVRKIRVSSSNRALSGAFSVQDEKAVLNNPDDISATVTLDCGTGGVGTSAEGTQFFIAIPAQGYKNLKVELSEDGENYTKSVVTKKDLDIEVECGKVYPIGVNELSAGGYNIYGYVKCGETPLAGVVVTDGYECVQTDASGMYRLKSNKEYGFVEISTPSGYRAPSAGVVPQFFARVQKEKYRLERHDFNLVEDGNQTQHTMLFFTDIHLAGRINDVDNFKIFENDINSYLSEHPTENVFGATMGDETFDTKWYQYNFFPADYVAKVDSAFAGKNFQMFHCIGNHDHEKGKKGVYPKGEIECSKRYKDEIGPNFYSYNIGQLHYVVLDNIYCTNDGTGDTSYECMVEQYMLDWLEKDLSYVDPSTPIVLQIHAPIWNYKGNYYSSSHPENTDALIAALGGRRTYVFSGHTHMLFTTDHLADKNIIDFNCGSVCGTWWVTQYYNQSMSLNREGTPAGYRIFKVNGTDVTWQYKAYGRPIEEQIRIYDLNKIDLRVQNWVTDFASKDTTGYAAAVNPYNRSFSNNNVFFVVYDWDPSWTITVKEGDTNKEYVEWHIKDPLHLIAYETIKYDNNDKPDSGYMTMNNFKMFRVACSSATSTVTVKATDRFGNVYTETATRPKPFSILEYSE